MRPQKEKKIYLSFYAEKTLVKRIDEIVTDPNNFFDDRSTLIRHCIKLSLPEIERELKQKEA